MSAGSPELANWLARFEAAAADARGADWSALFTRDANWRDYVSLSWTLVTVEGIEAIRDMARRQLPDVGFSALALDPKGMPPSDASGGWFTFETTVARGIGYARLSDGKCEMLLTTMSELKGHEEATGARRLRGVPFGAQRNRRTWLDEREETARTLGVEEQPYVLVVGGGQNGLILAARLKRLGVPTLVVDPNERPGDAWRKRYRSLYLHGPSYVDHFPFLPFPDHWPLYSSKDQMGEWLDIYARAMEIDFWGGARCTGAEHDEAAGEWRATIERDGETIVVRPKQLVIATGLSGAPYTPDFPGMASFAGDQWHSSEHGTRGRDARGKRCVVIGATNSAHDICQDLWENEAAEVTMVQRSPTIVVGIRSSEKIRAGAPWESPDLTTEAADLLGATATFRQLVEMERAATKRFAEEDADLLRRLRERGFLLTEGEDGAGFFIAYYRSAAGYYIDVGASDLVADGEVKLKVGSVAGIEPEGVRMDDGTLLPADIIVYATGYHPLEHWVGELISPEVTEKIGRCWGLGSGTSDDPGPWEGELRNMWKPTAQEGLWFQVGSINQSRFYSKYLALQLKARMEGLPTPVFGMREAELVS